MVSRLKNTSVALSSTDLTSLYTCPTNFKAIIREIFITNVDGSSAADITLSYTDTSASATFSLLSTVSVTADNYIRLNDSFIILESGDILKAQASAANDIQISIFLEEILKPQG